jgi:hypothetical protein
MEIETMETIIEELVQALKHAKWKAEFAENELHKAQKQLELMRAQENGKL